MPCEEDVVGQLVDHCEREWHRWAAWCLHLAYELPHEVEWSPVGRVDGRDVAEVVVDVVAF